MLRERWDIANQFALYEKYFLLIPFSLEHLKLLNFERLYEEAYWVIELYLKEKKHDDIYIQEQCIG